MPSRLWFRLLIGTCLLLAVTLGTVVLLVNSAVTASFQDYVEDQQSARVQRAESILSRYYDRRREWTGVEPTVQSVADLMGERLVLADAQGQIVADSQNAWVGRWVGDDWRGRRVSIRSQEFAVGTLYISPISAGQRPIDPRSQRFLSTLNSYLAGAAVVGLLAALALSVGLARWLAAPLESLTRAARRMERGDLQQRIDTSVGGEVGALADAFNALAASLARVERLRQDMVSDIAHELRTPLASIRGYLEAIQDGVVAPDAETLDTIHREMMQLTRLVDDLQELSLAEARQLQLHYEQVDVAELVEWEVRAFRPQAAAQQIEIAIDAPSAGALPLARLDAGRIRQVLGNILRNALAHTPDGGRIGVSVQGDEAHVRIAVEDSGVGIAARDLEHVFERFYRADKSRSRVRGGTGLGLTIARELVSAHQGQLTAESIVGRGTRFLISLPTAGPAPEAEPAPEPEPRPMIRRRVSPVELVAHAAMLGGLFGAAAGLAESWMAAQLIRKPNGFVDLFGYAVLIDVGVFAGLGAILAMIALAAAPLLRWRPSLHEVTRIGIPLGMVLVGLLAAYRWNGLFNKEAPLDSPGRLYSLVAIICASLVLAVAAWFAARVFGPRLSPTTLAGARRALPIALAVVIAAAGGLVGRDQLANRLSVAPAAAAVTGAAETPRSPDGRPGDVPAGAVLSPEAGPPAVASPIRPNVLLVTVSALRADHLGVYGYDKARTPSIDALARAGARFTNAVTQQPDINAAHAAILSGSYPSTNGVRADLVDRLGPSAPTLAQTLAEQGYRTAAIYSWVSFEPAYSGLDRGFHDYLDLTINRPEYLSDNRGQALAATYERLKAYLTVPGAVPAFSLPAGMDEALDGKADVTTEAAIAWIEEHRDEPFFLWVHYYDPHEPFSPPPPFDDVEDTGCGDTCPGGSARSVREIVGGAQLDAAQINHLVGLYNGEVAFTDQQIGRLLGRLGQLGLDRNTLVALTADHGQSFAEHDDWFSGSGLHGAETRVPLIVAMPGRVPPGMVVGAPAMGIDLAPTILDTIGAAVPDRFEGQSLLPLILGHSEGEDRLAVSELADKSQVALVLGDWKLIWSREDRAASVYHLPTDPNELNDRAEDEPETAARLLAALRAWEAARPS